jgi:hypothetical protein
LVKEGFVAAALLLEELNPFFAFELARSLKQVSDTSPQ